MRSWICATRQAATSSFSETSPRPKVMFARMVSWKRCASWVTKAMLGRGRSDPPSGDTPSIRT